MINLNMLFNVLVVIVIYYYLHLTITSILFYLVEQKLVLKYELQKEWKNLGTQEKIVNASKILTDTMNVNISTF